MSADRSGFAGAALEALEQLSDQEQDQVIAAIRRSRAGSYEPASEQIEVPATVREFITGAGGTITEAGRLPDGSGFATASFPLPKSHWLTQPGYNEPPMPLRMGTDEHIFVTTDQSRGGGRMSRDEFADRIRAAGRYAVRASTMNGAEIDFDPDAMLQNFVVGLLGYWTHDGLSHADDVLKEGGLSADNPPGPGNTAG